MPKGWRKKVQNKKSAQGLKELTATDFNGPSEIFLPNNQILHWRRNVKRPTRKCPAQLGAIEQVQSWRFSYYLMLHESYSKTNRKEPKCISTVTIVIITSHWPRYYKWKATWTRFTPHRWSGFIRCFLWNQLDHGSLSISSTTLQAFIVPLNIEAIAKEFDNQD